MQIDADIVIALLCFRADMTARSPPKPNPMPPLSNADPVLLASFYEGISRPQRFAQGLQRIGELLGCERVSMRVWDRRGGWGCASDALLRDGHWELKTIDDQFPEPALRALVGKLEPGKWKLVEQLHHAAPLAGGEARRRSEAWLCTRILLSQAEALLSLQRPERNWSPEQIEQARDACRLMLPALEPIARQRQLAQQVERISVMLDSLRMPMMLVDASQRALAANAAARGLFNLSGRTSSGKIAIALPGVPASQFAHLLKGACSKPAVGGVLPLRTSAEVGAAHLLVLPLRTHRASLAQPTALVLVQGLAATSAHAQPLLQHVYGLTPAEARLTLMILDGQSPGRAATALQLSVTTVRTQLSAVLKKTGAERQSDLVRRLAPLMLLEKDFASS